MAQSLPANCFLSDGEADLHCQQRGVETSGSTDAVGQNRAPHGTKGPCGLSVKETCLFHGTLINLTGPYPYDSPLPVVRRAAPLLL